MSVCSKLMERALIACTVGRTAKEGFSPPLSPVLSSSVMLSTQRMPHYAPASSQQQLLRHIKL